MSSTTAVFLLVCSVLSLALASGGSRLPHSATIIADDGVRVGGGPAAFEALVDENSTHNAVPADYGLPFSCQQQGCGPVRSPPPISLFVFAFFVFIFAFVL
jgi:hypothetical protein